MNSLEKLREFAQRLYQFSVSYDAKEKMEHHTFLLNFVTQLLDDTKSVHTLSMVGEREREMAEMAFGNPAFMMGPSVWPPAFADQRHFSTEAPLRGKDPLPFPFTSLRPSVPKDKHDEITSLPCSTDPPATEGPRLIIHESPTVKVTKVDQPEGTTLESLFLGADVQAFADLRREQRHTMDSGSMDAVDHESLHSDDIGINYGDDEEDEGGDEEDGEDKIPVTSNGKNYFRSLNSQRVFEALEDGTPGECVGVWLNDTFVPLVNS